MPETSGSLSVNGAWLDDKVLGLAGLACKLTDDKVLGIALSQ
jgi:hypothetical protein